MKNKYWIKNAQGEICLMITKESEGKMIPIVIVTSSLAPGKRHYSINLDPTTPPEVDQEFLKAEGFSESNMDEVANFLNGNSEQILETMDKMLGI